ncbi:S8 family serine peptidase [Arenimonas caeni]|jgi:subtilisin family serine protease|uniref:S8 family serine peptidase n=1 Tax=Arenimonas caeni TaxID=2058085 RepID=UPI002A36D5F6|nr:S8 family serine peptidase [Arenimonas caeni]MDY0022986.1 S8 family serine peptidase [Arenimonas caeni]
MKQHNLVRALALGLAVAFGATSASAAEGVDTDRVWVKFKKGQRANVETLLRGNGGRIHHRFDNLDSFAVSLPPKALERLRNNPNIEFIEADQPRYPLAQSVPYGIDLVQARDIWDANRDGIVDAGATTGAGIKVCIIDSGIHGGHEDFNGVNLAGGHPTGWNTDTCGHGSHVAGTIAAANNAAGVVGVSPGAVSLHIIKVFDGPNCGWSYSSTLVDAANRCAQAGAKVINMSLGGSTSSSTESAAFASLYAGGVLSIAAAGNDGNTAHSYPASYDSVISVAAVDSNKAHAVFSQKTNQVELAAPGVSVLSTVPFVSATMTVAGTGYLVDLLEGTHVDVATGALADGGRCTVANAAWAGKVVMCERGDISFADKVNNVANSGGAAAVVYNNAPGGFNGTLGGPGPAIPAVSMAQADGQSLVASQLGASATVSTVSSNQGNGYAYYDGTSMATPHVAGVAALVWSANPSWTAAQIREALAVTAEDLGTAGRDTSTGWGLVRAKAALDYLNAGGGDDGGGDTGGVEASVSGISLNTTSKGRNYTTTAQVTIVDGDGGKIGGASVTGCFSGAVTGCTTRSTNGNGRVTFTSQRYNGGSVTFCVTNVTGPVDSFNNANACRSN